MLNGTTKKIVVECPDCFNSIDLQAGGRFLSIREQFGEGNTWHLLDRKTAMMQETLRLSAFLARWIAVRLQRRPTLLPDTRAQCSNVYEVRDGTPKLAFEAIPDRAWPPADWGASDVCWIDNQTVGYTRVVGEEYRSSDPEF